jgi:hypothetical protein
MARHNNYAVIGDFGGLFQTELQVCADYCDAVEWIHSYIQRGDWGGYASLSVVNAETDKVLFTADADEY